MPRAHSHPTAMKGARTAADYRGRPEDAKDAGLARKCRCENPHTYRDEDGERRCLCGRAV